MSAEKTTAGRTSASPALIVAGIAALAIAAWGIVGGPRLIDAGTLLGILAIGAVVVVMSDGLERGDPAALVQAVQRLAELGPGELDQLNVQADPAFLSEADLAAALAKTATQRMTPLVRLRVGVLAEIIGFVASRPSHVNLDQIILKPRDQASARRNIKTG